jgi:pimeloyl-ACP methyl ester carboxylesterase
MTAANMPVLPQGDKTSIEGPMQPLAMASLWPDLSMGARPMLHVHGWCCDRRAMLPVARAFSGRGHLLVDLPGHGASPPGPDWAIGSHARAVLEVAPAGALLVGHSMGGQVVLAAAATAAPGQVSGVVLLDPAHIIPTEKALETGRRLADKLERHPPGEVVRAFARAQIQGPVADPQAFDALVEIMAATPPESARAQWAAILAWAEQGLGAAALERLAVPALVISCAKPVNRLADLARASRQVMTGQVAGAGHMLQFEAMDQVAPMVRRWLRLHAIP